MQQLLSLCIKYVKIFKRIVGVSAQRPVVSFCGYDGRGLVMSALETCLLKATGMVALCFCGNDCLSVCEKEKVRKSVCVYVCVCVSQLYMCHPLSEEYSERNPQIRASAARDLWDMYTHNLWLACS